jgi:hypothetical protein
MNRLRVDRVVARLVPPAVRAADGGTRALARRFGIALAIRLVLMPIACHADLISTYHRSYLVLDSFRPRWWLLHQLIQSGLLTLYSPFLALDELLDWQPMTHMASTPFWLETFAPHPQVFLALFLFKLPYLVCDFAIALVLLRIFGDAPDRALRAASMWLFSPVTIFVFYVFGRHDAIAILCVALGLLAIRRAKPLRGALAIGFAIWSRYWPIVVLPFLVAFAAADWRSRLKLVAVAVAPVVIFNSVASLQARETSPVPAVHMAGSQFAEYLLTLNFDLGWTQVLYAFPVAYALLLMFAVVAKPTEDPCTRFCRFAFCCLSLLYATSFFHPQYFTWCLLFLVILRADARTTVLRNLHYAQLLLLVPYTFYWRNSLFGYLFAPLDPAFFISVPAPVDWIEPHISPFVFVNFFRTLLSVVCVAMAGWVLLDGERRAAEAAAVTCEAPSAAAE